MTSADGELEVRYHRVERHRSPSTLTVVVASPTDDAVEVWMSADLAQGLGIDAVHPEPEAVTAAGERYVFEFAVEPGQGPLQVTFDGMPDALGWRESEVGIVGGGSVALRQFVLP